MYRCFSIYFKKSGRRVDQSQEGAEKVWIGWRCLPVKVLEILVPHLTLIMINLCYFTKREKKMDENSIFRKIFGMWEEKSIDPSTHTLT
jgi:hypothetical protein